MNTLSLAIFLICLGFDFLMATPLGFLWITHDLEEGNPCYGMIIAFATTVPIVITGCYLGIFK